MIFYSEQNVYESAKDRIRWIFDEFNDTHTISVSFSGGKDSTVILHLVKEVMDERGIKKIPVFFLDQEAEAPLNIEFIREVMSRDWVDPYWVQSHFREWNASKGDWFNVWGPGENWCREKEPNNPYADFDIPVKEDFGKVLHSCQVKLFGEKYIAIGGVRIEESPNRRLGLTTSKCYQDITWGTDCGKGALVLYPIWDWSCNDVWYYIFSNKLPYCKLYNYMFTKKSLPRCRVSSFIHENSIHTLKDLREYDSKFYKSVLKRVENVNTTVQTHDHLISYIGELPEYFKDWTEYVYYLADHIIEKPKNITKVKGFYDSTMKSLRKMFGWWQPGIEASERSIGCATAAAIVSENFVMSNVSNVRASIVKYYYENYAEIKKANRGNSEWVGKYDSDTKSN